jgi:type II secretory pathway pseudopilin PulG
MRARLRWGPAFTVIEVMIAVALLSAVALGVTTTLVAAQRARAVSERWMQATQLAAEGLEQLRAGHALAPIRIPGGFERSGRITVWNGHANVSELQVTVSWNDGDAHSFQLVTLMRR